jgi:predicted nucleic acid-binding protein
MIDSADESRSLVDTNVLIYAHDHGDPAKHAIALALLERLADQGRFVLSAQVLNEFCSVMMRPGRADRMSSEQILEILREVASLGEVVPVTASMTFRALGAMRPHGFSFWDALIWAAAAENGVPVVYTEDFQAGREVEGVRFVNPFVETVPPGA